MHKSWVRICSWVISIEIFPDPIRILVKSWWYWKIGEDCSSKLEKISTCQTPKYVVVLVDSCSVMYWARYGNSCTELGIDKYSRLAGSIRIWDCLLTVFLTVHRNDDIIQQNCRRYKILAVLEIFFNLTWTKFVENLEFIFEFVWFFCCFVSVHHSDWLAGTENKYTRLVFNIILRESDRISNNGVQSLSEIAFLKIDWQFK